MSGYCEQCGETICVCEEKQFRHKHSLSVGKTIQSRIYDVDTNEVLSFVKMTLEEAGLQKEREWQNLTDKEILDLYKVVTKAAWDVMLFARVIEARLREKNT